MDERFGFIRERFEAIDKRFKAVIWTIGFGVALTTSLTTVFGLLA